MVVGRDVRFLDEKGISRAAIETMSENFVDGFFSPIFWYLSGGNNGIHLRVISGHVRREFYDNL